MALTILDDTMSSDRSPHTARRQPGGQYAWEVSWLPGRHLNRDEAVTAMVLADTTASGDVRPGHRSWPHVEDWAAELGMTGPQALDRTAGQPRWAGHPGKTAGLPDPGLLSTGCPGASPRCTQWIEDPDPIDLGIAGEYFAGSPYELDWEPGE